MYIYIFLLVRPNKHKVLTKQDYEHITTGQRYRFRFGCVFWISILKGAITKLHKREHELGLEEDSWIHDYWKVAKVLVNCKPHELFA